MVTPVHAVAAVCYPCHCMCHIAACAYCLEASARLQGKLEGQLHAGIMKTVMFDAHEKPTFRDKLCLDVFAYAGRFDSVFHQTCIGH